jgi:hypothetical protein
VRSGVGDLVVAKACELSRCREPSEYSGIGGRKDQAGSRLR